MPNRPVGRGGEGWPWAWWGERVVPGWLASGQVLPRAAWQAQDTAQTALELRAWSACCRCASLEIRRLMPSR